MCQSYFIFSTHVQQQHIIELCFVLLNFLRIKIINTSILYFTSIFPIILKSNSSEGPLVHLLLIDRTIVTFTCAYWQKQHPLSNLMLLMTKAVLNVQIMTGSWDYTSFIMMMPHGISLHICMRILKSTLNVLCKIHNWWRS